MADAVWFLLITAIGIPVGGWINSHVTARISRTTAREPALRVFIGDHLLLGIPGHPERGIGQQEVEVLGPESVVGEGVAEVMLSTSWPLMIMSDLHIAYEPGLTSWPYSTGRAFRFISTRWS